MGSTKHKNNKPCLNHLESGAGGILKVILLTSLVWCVLDILILLTYSDCSNGMGWGCHSATDNSKDAGHNSANHIPGKRGALQYAHQVSQEFEPPKSQWEGYMKVALNSWKPAP